MLLHGSIKRADTHGLVSRGGEVCGLRVPQGVQYSNVS